MNVMRCRIICMEMIVKELTSKAYAENSVENRQFSLLRALHMVRSF